MSAAETFASQFGHGKAQTHRPWAARRFMRKLGAWGLTFFALKGIAWLMVPLMAMYLT